MTTASVDALPRTPGAIRDWLTTHSPEDTARFEAEYHDSLKTAAKTYDLTSVDTTIGQWSALIWGRTQQFTPAEVDLIQRFEADGDVSGFRTHPL